MVKQVDSETITEVLRIRHAVDSVGAPAHIDEGETHPWVALLQGFAHQDVIDSVWMHYTRESPRGVADGCNCFGTLARANAAFPPTPTAHTPRPPRPGPAHSQQPRPVQILAQVRLTGQRDRQSGVHPSIQSR